MAGTLFPIRLKTRKDNHSMAVSSSWLKYRSGKDNKSRFLWSDAFEIGNSIRFNGMKEI